MCSSVSLRFNDSLSSSCQILLTYFLIELQADLILTYVTVYTLAMASTALAVLLGCTVEDPKLAQEVRVHDFAQ
jgi:hypothetical protein